MNSLELTAIGICYPPDLVEARRALALTFDPGESFEIRALPSKATRLCSRDNLDAAIQDVAELSETNKAIFYTVNPVRSDLDHPAEATDVTRRSAVLIDIDPERPERDEPATDEEKAHAVSLTEQLTAWLNSQGWPAPIIYDSGNGMHLRYRIDLPNDQEAKGLIRRVQRSLAARFDTTGAKIGTGVISAAQLDRLPGTWNRKGPHTAERPHRRSTIVSVPDRLDIVPVELLGEVAGPAPGTTAVPAAAHRPAATPAPLPADGFTLTATADERDRRYAESARDQEYGRLARAPEGDRNNGLNRAAYALGQFIGSGLLDRDEIGAELRQIAARIGLDEREAESTIESGIKAGVAQPRIVPAPLAAAVGQEWPEPFLDPRPSAAPFPLEVLPESLGDLCTACAESYDCPVDFFAAPAVVLAGGVLGMSVNLRMTNTWQVQPHLYFLKVGKPGSKKSPALDLISRPLQEIDRQLHEEYRTELAAALPDDAKPTQRQLLVDDATREAIGLILAENPRGVVVLKDEGMGWIGGLDEYKGRGSDKQFWLTVNSGGPIKVNRKGNRETHIISRPCIALVGGLTPSSLGMIRASDRDDGWLDRILFSYPESRSHDREWRSADVPAGLLDEWRAAIQYLWKRQPIIEEGRQRPYLIRLEDDAFEVWKELYRDHWREADDPNFAPELHGPWAKLEGFTARFALILSQLRQAYDGEDGNPRNVDGVDMHHARLLSQYFKRHLERALHGVRQQQVPDVARLLIRKLIQERVPAFGGRLLTRNYGRYFREPDDLENTLLWLERHNIIRPRDPQVDSVQKRRGRPTSAQFIVNPLLFASPPDFVDRMSRS